MKHKFKDPLEIKKHQPREDGNIVKPLVNGVVALALVGAITSAIKK